MMKQKQINESGKIAKNATWLIVCKIIQSILSFLIGSLSARYLGPSNYGVIDYAAAIAAFAVPIIQLGLRATLVHELIAMPDREGEIMGTALFMSVSASLLGMLGIFAFASIANHNEPQTILVCVLYSISLIFQATEMIQYWFQSKLLSKYVAMTSLAAYTGVSVYRCILLLTRRSVYWFALSHALDYLLISVCLYVIFRRLSGLNCKVSIPLAKSMFSRSRYYIVSGIMVTFFSLTDRVMITLMLGKEANGYYSAAVSCAMLSQFVFAALIDSIRPAALSAKKNHLAEYERHIVTLYSMVFYLALLQNLVLTLAAPLIIRIIYGAAYTPAIATLRIVTWYTSFSYLGSVRNIWILAEQKQEILWKINLSGALLNIAANYLLIPVMGIHGAAIASVASQFFVNFALCVIIKRLQPVGRLMLQGMNPIRLKETWVSLVSALFGRTGR